MRTISVAALPVMFGAQALWAQSAAGTAAVNGGGAGGPAPVWSGYGPGSWMMGGWGGPGMSWSRLIGQFGGFLKLFPGCIYAASLLFSLAGASPGKAEISIS